MIVSQNSRLSDLGIQGYVAVICFESCWDSDILSRVVYGATNAASNGAEVSGRLTEAVHGFEEEASTGCLNAVPE